jgi:hypothetical protein
MRVKSKKNGELAHVYIKNLIQETTKREEDQQNLE